ncbi:MAG: hypothetical protein J7L32_05340 [Thermoplasmata archaeon]|nr:hypothetical protein [Thermoplasmata archaeon]
MSKETVAKVKRLCGRMDTEELREIIEYAEKRNRKLYAEKREKELRERKARIKALPEGAKLLILTGPDAGEIAELVEARREWATVKVRGKLWEYRLAWLTDAVDDEKQKQQAEATGRATRTLSQIFGGA